MIAAVKEIWRPEWALWPLYVGRFDYPGIGVARRVVYVFGLRIAGWTVV